ncbi:MAG: hypothetical protein M3Q58_16270 [Bacteroidota bacterium]|nr:hypothetical protein [Bacteroidota bacterium]
METVSAANLSSFQTIEVNTSNYSNGIYFFTPKTDTGRVNGKCVVSH